MKSGAVSALFVLGSLAASSTALAVSSNHSGTICKNYNAADAPYIDYLTNGTRSIKTSTTNIVCPMARNTSNTNGAYVYVDVTHSSSVTMTCTAYSYTYTGTLLGSVSATWTGSGFHEFALNLTGSGKSTAWSDYSVLCSTPGNRAAVINGVDLNES